MIKEPTIKLYSVFMYFAYVHPQDKHVDSEHLDKINIYHKNAFHFILYILCPSNQGDFLFQSGLPRGAPPKKETWPWRIFVLFLLD